MKARSGEKDELGKVQVKVASAAKRREMNWQAEEDLGTCFRVLFRFYVQMFNGFFRNGFFEKFEIESETVVRAAAILEYLMELGL